MDGCHPIVWPMVGNHWQSLLPLVECLQTAKSQEERTALQGWCCLQRPACQLHTWFMQHPLNHFTDEQLSSLLFSSWESDSEYFIAQLSWFLCLSFGICVVSCVHRQIQTTQLQGNLLVSAPSWAKDSMSTSHQDEEALLCAQKILRVYNSRSLIWAIFRGNHPFFFKDYKGSLWQDKEYVHNDSNRIRFTALIEIGLDSICTLHGIVLWKEIQCTRNWKEIARKMYERNIPRWE